MPDLNNRHAFMMAILDRTEQRDEWLDLQRHDRRMRHLGFCVKVLVGAFALAYLSILWELF